MKQLNNIISEVYLSTYDNSDTLLPVSEEYKSLENVCVAVKFGDTLIKISPENTCKCNWYDAMNKYRGKFTHPAYWQMVGSVYREVNQAIEMLEHEPIGSVWTDAEEDNFSGNGAWYYSGTYGGMGATSKRSSSSVRAAKVFKIEE